MKKHENRKTRGTVPLKVHWYFVYFASGDKNAN
jgi:hypothetical protein